MLLSAFPAVFNDNIPSNQPPMRLTTKGRYAVTAMIDLAIHQPGGPVTLKSISENQGISLSYLEQLFSMLRRSNLVKGTRGPGGGYRLARNVDLISMADIVVAVDEPLDITQCDGREDCHDGKRCLSHDLWSELSDQLYSFLHSIRLSDMYRMHGSSPEGKEANKMQPSDSERDPERFPQRGVRHVPMPRLIRP